MKTKAAVLVKLKAPLQIRELEVPAIKRGQVLVRIKAAGVCHSQLSEVSGERGKDQYLPHLLGHEASGVIEAIGPDVKKVKPGDFVVLTWIKGRGLSPGGVEYNGQTGSVNAGAIAVFSEYAVVNESRVVPVKFTGDPAVAALFGCAVPTGVGAIINTLGVRRGSTIAVFGTGGVGLCAIMAAKLRHTKEIIAIDIVPSKLEAAKKAGASQCINGNLDDAVAVIKNRHPGGIDYAVSAVGVPRVIEQAFEVIGDRGLVAVVGHPPHGQTISIDPYALIKGKNIVGSWGGGVNPDKDIPQYLKWYSQGQLPVGMLISKEYSLMRINDALHDLARGQVLRPIIKF